MIKITPIQAADFMKLGYEVQCFVDLPRIVDSIAASLKTAITRPIRQYCPMNAEIGRSLEGKQPIKGKAGIVWAKLDKQLWGDDVTLLYSRKHIEHVMIQLGNTDLTLFTYLINRCKCIRKIIQEKT